MTTKLFTAAAIGALVLAACQHAPESQTAEAEIVEAAAQASEAAAIATEQAAESVEASARAVAFLAKPVDALKIYVFDCGKINVSNVGVFSANGYFEGQERDFSDTCYLIRHPEGDLLWDLGLPGGLAGMGPQPSEGSVFTPSLERTLVDQMAGIGVTPADIDYVSISHYHFDHIGQPDAAGEATWLISEREYNAIYQSGNDELKAQFAGFEALTPKVFTGDFDVFGDNSVRILQTPGHTEGHTSLQVELPETGTVLLTGDLYHQFESRTEKLVPGFNTSADETLASMDKFEGIADVSEAKVIIQHEARDYATLPKPPEALK